MGYFYDYTLVFFLTLSVFVVDRGIQEINRDGLHFRSNGMNFVKKFREETVKGEEQTFDDMFELRVCSSTILNSIVFLIGFEDQIDGIFFQRIRFHLHSMALGIILHAVLDLFLVVGQF